MQPRLSCRCGVGGRPDLKHEGGEGRSRWEAGRKTGGSPELMRVEPSVNPSSSRRCLVRFSSRGAGESRATCYGMRATSWHAEAASILGVLGVAASNTGRWLELGVGIESRGLRQVRRGHDGHTIQLRIEQLVKSGHCAACPNRSDEIFIQHDRGKSCRHSQVGSFWGEEHEEETDGCTFAAGLDRAVQTCKAITGSSMKLTCATSSSNASSSASGERSIFWDTWDTSRQYHHHWWDTHVGSRRGHGAGRCVAATRRDDVDDRLLVRRRQRRRSHEVFGHSLRDLAERAARHIEEYIVLSEALA